MSPGPDARPPRTSRRARSLDPRALRSALLGATTFVAALQIANNLLPYVGLRDDSCQTMFSGLIWGDRKNNHLLLPQRTLSDLSVYYPELHAEVTPEAGGRLGAIVAWLRQEGVQHNAEAVRVAVRQLCDAGHVVRVTYRPRAGAPLFEDVEACRDPRLSAPHGWIPVRLYDSHLPAAAPAEGAKGAPGGEG